VNTKIYLGDSVYLNFEVPGCVVLTTENGRPDTPSNEIVLEDAMVQTLYRYWKQFQRTCLINQGDPS
jgi:hypothetical protein